MNSTKLHIVAVCGPHSFKGNEWIFSDFGMLRGLLPVSESDNFLTCVNLDLEKRLKSIRLHRQPTTDRTTMDLPLSDLSWVARVKKPQLKDSFLEKVTQAVAKAASFDHVLIAISGLPCYSIYITCSLI